MAYTIDNTHILYFVFFIFAVGLIYQFYKQNSLNDELYNIKRKLKKMTVEPAPTPIPQNVIDNESYPDSYDDPLDQMMR